MILGLPVHPMLVHFAVALLVLVPLAVLVSLVWKGLRNRLDWLLPIGAVGACLVALITGQFGEVLQHSLPKVLPAVTTHSGWGEWAMRSSIAFAVTIVLWWASVTEHPFSWADRPFLRGRGVQLGLSILAGVVSVITLVVVTLTGHSGAVAVWG